MLIVFSGLPGSGKTTLAYALAARRGATYLRVDTIEQAIRNAEARVANIGPAGYAVANAVAEANLSLGRTVVADCVNPVDESRAAWRDVAVHTKSTFFNIEVLCSDPIEHRRRVETRVSDIVGLTSATWESVQQHEYEPWETERLVLDTALLSPSEALVIIERHLGEPNTR